MIEGSFGTKTMRDGTRWHCCMTCDYEWPAERRHLWWPVRLRFVRHRHPPKGHPRQRRFFGQHGYEVGTDALWRQTFARVLSVGRVRVICGGKGFAGVAVRACPHCGAVHWQKDAESVAPHVPRWQLWRIELRWRLRYSRESYESATAAFRNVFRTYQDTEEAVRIVTGPATLAEIRGLVRRKEDVTKGKGGA